MKLALRLAMMVAFAGGLAGWVIAAGSDDEKKAPAGAEVLRDGFETQQPVWSASSRTPSSG